MERSIRHDSQPSARSRSGRDSLQRALCHALIFVAVLAQAQAVEEPGSGNASANRVVASVRTCLDQGQGKRAVQLIEDELASNPGSRTELVDWLKKSYVVAINEAARNGRTAEATDFRECLAILNRRPKRAEPVRPQTTQPPQTSTAPSPVSTPPVKTVAPTASTNSSTKPPTGSPLPKPDNLLIHEPEELAGLNPLPAPAESRPLSDQAPPSSTLDPSAPAGKSAKNSTVKDVSVEKVVREQSENPIAGKADANPAPAVTDEHEADPMAQADALFRDKKYEEAGLIYSALYRDEKLPESRNPIWAYCRRFTVVKRINAGPRSAAEWQSIREEILRIQQFSPKHWYDQYLLEFVQENARRTEAGQRPATIRGASPEEPNRKGTGKSSRSPAGNPGTGRVQPKPQKGNLDSEEPPTELTVFPQETSYQGTQDSSLISLRDLGIIRR